MTPAQLAEMGLAINKLVTEDYLLRNEIDLLRAALVRCRTQATTTSGSLEQVKRIVDTVFERLQK